MNSVTHPAARESATTTTEKRGYSTVILSAIALLYCVVFADAVREMVENYNSPDSYYTHGYIIPFISLYFVWRKREELRKLHTEPSRWGLWMISGCGLLVLAGDFLGFRIIAQFAMILALAGIIMSLWGNSHVRALWFPVAFLLFMIPIPTSITLSLVLYVKLLAIDCTVWISQLFGLPMVRDGSYIAFGNDRLLVGEVCGGLRSLIALLALGSLLAYMSKARPWARVTLLFLSAPVAILANVFRIFFLCLVAYMWGSSNATGKLHDASGIAIYAVAALLLSGIEFFLRRVAPQRKVMGGETAV